MDTLIILYLAGLLFLSTIWILDCRMNGALNTGLNKYYKPATKHIFMVFGLLAWPLSLPLTLGYLAVLFSVGIFFDRSNRIGIFLVIIIYTIILLNVTGVLSTGRKISWGI